MYLFLMRTGKEASKKRKENSKNVKDKFKILSRTTNFINIRSELQFFRNIRIQLNSTSFLLFSELSFYRIENVHQLCMTLVL